jgi:hypothetical protein
MNNTPGPSDLLNNNGGTPPADAGMTAGQAFERLAELRRDVRFQEDLARGTPEARAKVEELARAVTNGSAIAGKGVDPASLGPGAAAAAAARDKLAIESTIDSMRNVVDISDDVANMIRNNTPVSAQEQKMAAQERSRLMNDPDFVKAYLGGNRAARQRMVLIDIITSRPTAA